MPNSIIDSLKPSLDDHFKLLDDFIKACPDSIWTGPCDSWPVWQHVYHILFVNDFFIPGDPAPIDLASPDIALLKIPGTTPITKTAINGILPSVKERTKKYLDSLTDADLSKTNEKIAKAMNREWTHAYSISKLSSHAFYHLGCLDTSLRNNGLKGVF